MTQSHYEVLGLQQPRSGTAQVSQEDIKAAYRTALLAHHPDKLKYKSISFVLPLNTIDEIRNAYATLSDDKLRLEYDKTLLVKAKEKTFQTGEEVLDLDDLPYDEDQGVWYKSCRCGQDRGFALTEAELEAEASRGGREIVVGCVGCSLWIRVAFDVAEEDEEDGKVDRTAERQAGR